MTPFGRGVELPTRLVGFEGIARLMAAVSLVPATE
jgi:hypothetical protein